MDDLDVNMAIWGIFLNATLRAAVHLGQDYEANLRYVKNHLWNSVGQLFNGTEKLISGQTEITGLNTIRQACCVAEVVSTPTPKPTSSPTLCWKNGR